MTATAACLIFAGLPFAALAVGAAVELVATVYNVARGTY